MIPQVKRSERLTADQLKEIYVTGAGGKLVPLSTFATLRTTTRAARAQALPAAQRRAHPGRDPAERLARPGAALPGGRGEEDPAAGQGYTVDYSGESRQLRIEGGKFLGTFLLSAILIYLVLAAQFESFRDPFIILAGSVPLALSGALLFSFLGLHLAQRLQPGGIDHAGRPGGEERHPDRPVRQPSPGDGAGKLDAVIEAATTRLRPILMTTAATVVGHLPLVFAHGPGAGARNSIGIMLVSGMIIGTLFTLFVVPSIYILVARTHRAAAIEEEREAERTRTTSRRSWRRRSERGLTARQGYCLRRPIGVACLGRSRRSPRDTLITS